MKLRVATPRRMRALLRSYSQLLKLLLLCFLLFQMFRQKRKFQNAFGTNTWARAATNTKGPISLNLTVVVLTNLVPDHPDTWFIDTTLDSMYYHMHGLPPDTPVIIAGDGLNYGEQDPDNKERWEKYQQRLGQRYNESFHRLHFLDTHAGISGLLRNVWTKIQTEFVLVIQHDLAFVKPVQLPTVIEAMETYPKEVPMVRFNLSPNVPTTVREKLWSPWKTFFNSSTNVTDFKDIHFVKTAHWSDNNHLCRKSYYDSLWEFFGEHGAFHGKLRAPERIMTMDLIKLDFPKCDRYCTHLYGAYGESPYLYHLDGRLGHRNETFSFK